MKTSIALYYEKLISKALRYVWHVLTRDHTVLPATHMFIHKWNEPYLPLLPSRRVSPHFGQYSFSVPLRVECWVGLSGWSQTELVYLMVTYPSIIWARCRVSSLIETNALALSQWLTGFPWLHTYVYIYFSKRKWSDIINKTVMTNVRS